MHITSGTTTHLPVVLGGMPLHAAGPLGQVLESLADSEGGSVALLYASNGYDGRMELTGVMPSRLMQEFPSFITPAVIRSDSTQLPEAATIGGSAKTHIETLSAVHQQGLKVGAIEPIVSSGGRVLGVLCLLVMHNTSPTDRTVDLIQMLAPCISWVLEQGQVYETARRDSLLVDLLQTVADSSVPDVSLSVILRSIVNLGLRVESCGACAVYFPERGHPNFRIRSVATAGRDQLGYVPNTLALDDLATGIIPQRILLEEPPTCENSTVAGQRSSILVAPAFIENRKVGMIVAFDHERREYTPEDAIRLGRLAQALAATIRNRELIERTGSRTSLIELMWELLVPGEIPTDIIVARLTGLGCDITMPHIVMIGDAPTPQAAEALRRRILDLDRSAPVAIDFVRDKVTAIVQSRLLSELVVEGVTVGASRPVRRSSDYPMAYREAIEALELGGKNLRMKGLIRFEDLGGYRFVPALVESGLTRDSLYLQVSRLSDDLLLTLEAYLGSGGNTVQAARQLFIHRNTMRQRMDKMRSLLDVDPTDPQQWLYLQLATMVTRSSKEQIDQT